MAPKMVPKLVQKLIISWSIFGSLLCWVLELFGCLLVAFLGLLRLSWEAFGPQKPRKTEGFLRFLQMQVFGSLKLSMALLGSSWPLLGPIWSQNGPQNGPQNCPKVVQKVVQMIPARGPQTKFSYTLYGNLCYAIFAMQSLLGNLCYAIFAMQSLLGNLGTWA